MIGERRASWKAGGAGGVRTVFQCTAAPEVALRWELDFLFANFLFEFVRLD
jgi:hypothetical protein